GDEQPEVVGEADLAHELRGEVAPADPDRLVGGAADGGSVLRRRADLHFRIAKVSSLYESIVNRRSLSVKPHRAYPFRPFAYRNRLWAHGCTQAFSKPSRSDGRSRERHRRHSRLYTGASRSHPERHRAQRGHPRRDGAAVPADSGGSRVHHASRAQLPPAPEGP